MVAWSGIGMNYGHQATYATNQVESDFTYLASIGITRVRIAMPGYTNTTSIANAQDMVARALTHGFQVVWGVSTGVATGGGMTSTTWTAYKNYVTGTLAPWAQSNGLLEMSLGNEAELQCDGTTITASQIRSDVRSMASTVKTNGYTGKVTYSTSILSTYRAPWASEGIGSLDYLAWNSYDTLANFQGRSSAIVSQFGSTTYISEFSAITLGYADYNDESAWYTDVVNRVSNMQSAGVLRGYFFCYRDGGSGLGANTFALQETGGQTRKALDAIKNVVTLGYSSFMAHR